MKVPLLDLKAQYQTLRDRILEVTQEVYDSQYFILGPKVAALEEAIARYCRAEYGVGVSSGTDALVLSLMAAGIGAGDRVVTTPYTFFATAGSIVRVGAVPVFVDIDHQTYNLAADKLEACVAALDGKVRRQIKAIIPVHLYGQCADMDPILKVAADNGWLVIEDAAQAIGAEYQGRRAGSIGDYGCFSFFPSKNLGAFGDGGMVTTTREPIAERLRILRNHGADPKYYHQWVGGNFRLDALQAAIITVKLAYLDQWTAARQANARRYRERFHALGLSYQVRLPVAKENRHVYNQFVIQVGNRRDQLRRFLEAAGIGTEVYYPVPLHLQQCFAGLGYGKGDFPVAEKAAETTLALPIYPELTSDQQTYVVESINAFLK